ncbi:neprilysin-1-like [Ornithodoros turicata]|uniref:neprilysin-1-like n=1 Tax=Ornithodoros turicata TaxID=34597 RepID=UPI0031390546
MKSKQEAPPDKLTLQLLHSDRRFLVFSVCITVTACLATIGLILANDYTAEPQRLKLGLSDIRAVMDTEVDPCEDFYRYVCGQWDAVHPDDENTYHITDRLVEEQLENIVLTGSPDEQRSATEKVAEAVRLCSKVWDQKQEHSEHVLSFLEKLELRVPFRSGETRVPHPVTVLVNLALRASIFLVLGLQPMVDLRHSDGRMIMAITPQRMFHDIILGSSNYLNNTAATAAGRNTYSEDVRVVHKFVKSVLRYGVGGNPEYITLDSLAKRTPKVGVSLWLYSLNLNVNPPLRNASELYLFSPLPLNIIRSLLSKFEGRYTKILNWITYMVHVYFSDASSYTFRSRIDEPTSRCHDYVFHVAPFAAAVRYSEGLVSLDEVELLKHMYRSMTDVMPQSFTWMKNESRAGALHRFGQLTPVFGVPKELSSPIRLDRYYAYLPTFQEPFIVGLLQAYEGKAAYALRRYAASFNGTRNVETRFTTDWENPRPVVSLAYRPYFHEILVQSMYMIPPFVNHGSLAVSYGISGHALAREITHSYDTQNVRARPDGVADRGPEHEDYKKRIQCILRLYDKDVAVPHRETYSEFTLDENIADVGGMHLALAAAKADECDPLKGDSPLPGLTNLQLFFIASCYQFCTWEKKVTGRVWLDSHARNDHRCEIPARAIREFYRAFECNLTESNICPFY